MFAAELNVSLGGETGAEGPDRIEKAWAEEVERRADAIIAGRSRGRAAEEGFADLRAQLDARQR